MGETPYRLHHNWPPSYAEQKRQSITIITEKQFSRTTSTLLAVLAEKNPSHGPKDLSNLRMPRHNHLPKDFQGCPLPLSWAPPRMSTQAFPSGQGLGGIKKVRQRRSHPFGGLTYPPYAPLPNKGITIRDDPVQNVPLTGGTKLCAALLEGLFGTFWIRDEEGEA